MRCLTPSTTMVRQQKSTSGRHWPRCRETACVHDTTRCVKSTLKTSHRGTPHRLHHVAEAMRLRPPARPHNPFRSDFLPALIACAVGMPVFPCACVYLCSGSGSIDAKELAQIFKAQGQQMSLQEVQDLINEVWLCLFGHACPATG